MEKTVFFNKNCTTLNHYYKIIPHIIVSEFFPKKTENMAEIPRTCAAHNCQCYAPVAAAAPVADVAADAAPVANAAPVLAGPADAAAPAAAPVADAAPVLAGPADAAPVLAAPVAAAPVLAAPVAAAPVLAAVAARQLVVNLQGAVDQVNARILVLQAENAINIANLARATAQLNVIYTQDRLVAATGDHVAALLALQALLAIPAN